MKLEVFSSSKNDDELKISESQLRETIDFVINSIGEHLDFYKLMFNLGKESIYMKNYTNY